jgi:hypothetical protein
MRFINVSEGEKLGDLAINFDHIKYARRLGGGLDLYFGGDTDERLTLEGTAATQVWREIVEKLGRS